MKTGYRIWDFQCPWCRFVTLAAMTFITLAAARAGFTLFHSLQPSVATVLSVMLAMLVGRVVGIWLTRPASSSDLLQTNRMDPHLLNLFLTSLEAKHTETRRHSDRVAVYLVWFAEQVCGRLSEAERQALTLAGALHDIGKMRVPTPLLASTGRLSPEEIAILRGHPEYGLQLIRGIPAFTVATSVVLHHHERYDGNGYPSRLRGGDIPLDARMAAVVDTFDAMTGQRAYRRPLSPERALQEIIAHSGSQFDPMLVERFVQEFHHVRKLYTHLQATPIGADLVEHIQKDVLHISQ